MKVRLNFFGIGDTEMRKAIVYRENYLKALKEFSNLDGYDKLIEKLNTIKNPLEFYERIKHHELTSDIKIMYFPSSQQEFFNMLIEDWEIEKIDEIY